MAKSEAEQAAARKRAWEESLAADKRLGDYMRRRARWEAQARAKDFEKGRG